MSNETRNKKIADAIQRELSEIIRLGLRDPRVTMVTITDVELKRDNSHAKIFFTSLGGEAQIKSCQQGLQSAAGFLRTQLAGRLTIPTVPDLHFAVDNSVERGVNLSKLIDEALADDAKHPE